MSKIMEEDLMKNIWIGYFVLSNAFMAIMNMEGQEWVWQFVKK